MKPTLTCLTPKLDMSYMRGFVLHMFWQTAHFLMLFLFMKIAAIFMSCSKPVCNNFLQTEV